MDPSRSVASIDHAQQFVVHPSDPAGEVMDGDEEQDVEEDDDEQECAEAKDTLKIPEDPSVYCPHCQTWTNGPKQYEYDLIGKKHRKNMKRRKQESVVDQAVASAETIIIKPPPELEETKNKSPEADWLNNGLEELMKTQTRDCKSQNPKETPSPKRHRRSRCRRGDGNNAAALNTSQDAAESAQVVLVPGTAPDDLLPSVVHAVIIDVMMLAISKMQSASLIGQWLLM
jgi:superfamily II DNA helicase RecQ